MQPVHEDHVLETRVRVEVGGTALGSAQRDHITALGHKTYLLMFIFFVQCNNASRV